MTRTVLLALETSTEFCSVALLISDASAPMGTGTERLWVRHEQTGAVSSTRVLPAVRELFDEAGVPLAECHAVAFGAGPGSFTGLRTATGIAQGLAFGLDVPVVPISTLLVCAEHARSRDPSADRVLVALDARMEEAYWAEYAWQADSEGSVGSDGGEWRVVKAPSLAAPALVGLPDAPFVLAGNAAAAFGEKLAVAARARSIDGAALPHAGPLATAALRAYRAGRSVRADQAAPDYVRDKVAQTTAERLAAAAGREGASAR
jgi:tRNA threonylcarbamoyladenosine biosynthesis protein TsaB